MKEFKAPKIREFDFLGILTRHDYKQVDKYIERLEAETEEVEKYLKFLKKQRTKAAEFRLRRIFITQSPKRAAQ